MTIEPITQFNSATAVSTPILECCKPHPLSAQLAAIHTLLNEAKMSLHPSIELNVPIEIPQEEPQKVNCLGITAAKTERIGWLTLTSLSSAGIGAMIAVGALGLVSWPIALSLTVPFLVSTGFSAWFAAKVVDYDDHKTLQGIKESAKSMPLSKIIESHGWAKIFEYGIISSEQFSAQYRDEVKLYPLNHLFSYYETVAEQYRLFSNPRYPFEIPHPREFKPKWKEETRLKSCDRVLKEYSLELLCKYEILEPAEMKVLNDLRMLMESARDQYQVQASVIHQEYEYATTHERYALQSAIEIADNAFTHHWGHYTLTQIEQDYAHHIEKIELKRDLQTASARKQLERMQAFLTQDGKLSLDELSVDDLRRWELEKQEFEAKQSESMVICNDELSEAEAQYLQRKKDCEIELECAAQARDRQIAVAQQHYERVTEPKRVMRDNKLSFAHQQLEQSLMETNRRYDEFRMQ